MMSRDCFEKYGRIDLSDRYDDLIKKGMSGKEAGRQIVLDEHKKLFDQLNDFKKGIGLKKADYKLEDISPKLKYINDTHDKLVDEQNKIKEQQDKENVIKEQEKIKKQEEDKKEKQKQSDIKELQGSYDRLSEGLSPEQIKNDEGLQRIKNRIDELSGVKKTDEGDKNTVGIRHESLEKLSDKLGLGQQQRGTFLSPEKQTERGRQLLSAGANPQAISDEFHRTGKISADDISVVRAHLENLVRAEQTAATKFGNDSIERKEAAEKVNQWKNEVAKEMGTAAGGAFSALQGEADLDTGSFVAMERAVKEKNGDKELTPTQSKEIKELSDKVSGLNNEVETLKNKLTEVIEKGVNEGKATKNIKSRAKDIAAIIRKGKLSRPDIFSSASPASLVWDGALETAAKTVEAAGTIAQAISDGLEHIKNSDWYKGLAPEQKNEAENAFKNHLNDRVSDQHELSTQFVNKKGNSFTPEEAKDIWDYTKENYLEKGVPYTDMINNTATDLGLSYDQVVNAISQPKGAKEVTLEMFKKQYERNKAVRRAQEYVQSSNNSKARKFFNYLPSAFFNLKTYGHGTVGFFTHAGPNAFRPGVWGSYWPNFLKQFTFAYGDTGKYQMAMESLKKRPNFDTWNRAGLAVDPSESYDEYQMFGHKLSWMGEAGTRGFNALKVLRYDMAESFYHSASESAKADGNYLKDIAKLVNHATGATEVKTPKWLSASAFAPGLEISRWQRMITDPAKAIKTYGTWWRSTPSERAAAKIVASGAGQRLAVYGTLLAANAGLLSYLGSKQKINFDDPSQSDWLKFKAGDKTIDFTSGVLNPMRLLTVLGRGAYLSVEGTPRELKTKPQDKDFETIGQQARYKASPIMGTGLDLLTGQDALGNPLPWSNIRPGFGKHKLDFWTEYVPDQLPIPIEAGVKAAVDGMRSRGMSDIQINDIGNGLLQFGVEGFTGVKMSDDYSLKENR